MKINQYIDHTILKADATQEKVQAIIDEAKNTSLQVFVSIQHG